MSIGSLAKKLLAGCQVCGVNKYVRIKKLLTFCWSIPTIFRVNLNGEGLTFLARQHIFYKEMLDFMIADFLC